MPRACFFALALILCASCGTAATLELPPGTTVDQSSEWTPLASTEAFGSNVPLVAQVREVAQTFTVGRTGTLSGFLVRMGTDQTATLTVRVLPTIAGVPDPMDANALATWTYAPGEVPLPGSTWFLTIPGGLAVTVGQQFALSVSYPGGQGGWIQSGADNYAGGAIYERDPNVSTTWVNCCTGDLLFASYVGP